MRHLFLFLSLTLAIFSSCNKEESLKDSFTNPNAEVLFHNGINREYVLYIPSTYNSSSSIPILFNFHGFGGNATEFMNNADFRSLAESENFILVYPQGSELDGFSHWNTSLPGGNNKSNADDFGFIEAIINEISSSYNIDENRIYACGYSNGGMFAYGLANYKSNIFAAVGSVSGTMVDFNGPTNRPMPIIHLHGTSDNVIPYNGNNDYNSTTDVINYWINFNNTISSPIVNSDANNNNTIEHYLYDQGDNNVSVEHYKYIGGGHVWFTAKYQNFNTQELIWNFFSKYDINGLK